MVTQTQKYPNGTSAPAQSAAGECSMPEPLRDLGNYLKEYARTQPEMAALWCAGIGFVLGWKLRSW